MMSLALRRLTAATVRATSRRLQAFTMTRQSVAFFHGHSHNGVACNGHHEPEPEEHSHSHSHGGVPCDGDHGHSHAAPEKSCGKSSDKPEGGCGSASCACAAKESDPETLRRDELFKQFQTLLNEIVESERMGQYHVALEKIEELDKILHEFLVEYVADLPDNIEASEFEQPPPKTEEYSEDFPVLPRTELLHPAFASLLNNRALLLRKHTTDLHASLFNYQRALRSYRLTVGSSHPSYLVTLSNVGLIFRELKLYDRAEQAFTTVVNHLRMTLPKDYNYDLKKKAFILTGEETSAPKDPFTKDLERSLLTFAQANLNLATLYSHTKKFTEADNLFEESLAVLTKKFGSDHPLTATVYNNMGTSFRLRDDLDKAVALYQKGYTIRAQNLPPDHPDIIASMNNIAETLTLQGKETEANEYRQKILTILGVDSEELDKREAQSSSN